MDGKGPKREKNWPMILSLDVIYIPKIPKNFNMDSFSRENSPDSVFLAQGMLLLLNQVQSIDVQPKPPQT